MSFMDYYGVNGEHGWSFAHPHLPTPPCLPPPPPPHTPTNIWHRLALNEFATHMQKILTLHFLYVP